MLIFCPACAASTDHRLLFTKNGCDILQCAGCGLARAQTDGFNPATYYTGDYFAGGHADGYADYRRAEPILRREFARTVEFIRRYRPSGRLLEIGCAYGFFLDEARSSYDVAGIEIAEDAAASCRQRNLRVITGVADEGTLAEFGKADVIVLLDVIEHLPQPHQTLALCQKFLSPGGVIVLTTGDIGSPFARIAGRHWRLMTPPQHLWYFSPESVRRLARILGLELEALDHPWKLVPLSLISYQLRRMLGIGQPRAGGGSHIGIPVNMFDAMRCVLRRPEA